MEPLDQLAITLRLAVQLLAQAADQVDAMPADAVHEPGKGYLLARLEMALEIISMELPEEQERLAEEIRARVHQVFERWENTNAR